MAETRIVLPVYNRAKYVTDAVESVLSQTTGDWDLVIVDDGSTDDTLAVLQVLSESEDRIQVIHQSNAGVATARNTGIDADGEYRFLAFLDSDDIWVPNHLEESMRFFELCPEAGIVFARTEMIDRVNKYSREYLEQRDEMFNELGNKFSTQISKYSYVADNETALTLLLEDFVIPQPSSVVIRTELVGKPRFPRDLKLNEDVLLWSILAHRGVSFGYLNARHVYQRTLGDNLTTKFSIEDPRVLPALHAAFDCSQQLRKLCLSRRHFRHVNRRISKAGYLYGQALAEQGMKWTALRSYWISLCYGGGWRTFRSMLAVGLPETVVRYLKSFESFLLKKCF